MVIEKENVMGGHTNTFTDPKTKQTVDYGVIGFENIPLVKDYFNYLQVPWTTSVFVFGGSTSVTKYFDFGARKIVNNVTAQNPENGLEAYASQLAKYPKLAEGFFLPNPVPDDLLLPFGEFVAKYEDISDAVSIIFDYCQGLGDVLHQPTLYVFKLFNLNTIKDLADGFIFTKNGDNSDIYNSAYTMLKNNVLLQSPDSCRS